MIVLSVVFASTLSFFLYADSNVAEVCDRTAGSSISGFVQNDEEPLKRKKFIYKRVDDRELAIYVTTPDKWSPADSRPAILFFHGGGWVGGKPGQFDKHAEYLASRGMVCCQVQYRLLDRKQPKQSPEICIHDAKSAMRWVRKNAKRFGIDAKRIASAGGSAGGHLAAAVGMIDGVNDPQDKLAINAKSNAMILFNPVFDNGPGGWGEGRVGEDYPKYSPVHNASSDDPPSLVFLGSNDKLIPVKTVEDFAASMKKLDVISEFKIYQGEGHGFFNHGLKNGAYDDTIKLTDQFLRKLGWLEGDPKENKTDEQ